jgi:hypothetical protein
MAHSKRLRPNAKLTYRGGSGSYELGINSCRRGPVQRLIW